MSPFVRIITLASLCAAALLGPMATLARADEPGPQTSDPYAGVKFICQAQCGFATYAQITSSFNLATMRQAFSSIDVETPAYIIGDYTLSGRTDRVKLVLTAGGWALAAMSNSLGVEYLYDGYVGYTTSLAEKGIDDILAMVNVTSTVKSYYDFRYPTATGAISHWLYQTGNKDLYSTLTLPINNLYLDRGYAAFTAASGSKFWLNGQILFDRSPSMSIIYQWGKLDSQQLRAGQANTLRQYSLTLFGTGFVAGVAVTYSGPITPTTTGGDHRDYPLVYPAMIGGPLLLHKTYLPANIN